MCVMRDINGKAHLKIHTLFSTFTESICFQRWLWAVSFPMRGVFWIEVRSAALLSWRGGKGCCLPFEALDQLTHSTEGVNLGGYQAWHHHSSSSGGCQHPAAQQGCYWHYRFQAARPLCPWSKHTGIAWKKTDTAQAPVWLWLGNR